MLLKDEIVWAVKYGTWKTYWKDFIVTAVVFISRVVFFIYLLGLIGFVVYLLKVELLNWRMVVILVLMLACMATTLFSSILTMSFIHPKHDRSFAMAAIAPLGLFGYIFTPVGMYFIYSLSSSLAVMWPVYVTAVLLALIVLQIVVVHRKR